MKRAGCLPMVHVWQEHARASRAAIASVRVAPGTMAAHSPPSPGECRGICLARRFVAAGVV